MANLVSGIGGAASGGALGGMIAGSVVPGIGNLIGAGIGGLAGLFGGGDSQKAPPNMGYQGLNDYIEKVDPSTQANIASLWDPTKANDVAKGQVAGDTMFGQNYGQQQNQYNNQYGLQQGQEGILNNLQNQGFNLTPQDQTLYGQESGNIARQFGQQGNQAAQNLASRGLSNSGAAGAEFSGMAGNQNEMLAQAQQQIAQQRFQNTMQQIGQQQQFIGQLGAQNQGISANMGNQYQGALNSNKASNLQGAQQYTNALGAASNAATGNINQAQFNAQQNPTLGNALTGAAGQAIGGMFAKPASTTINMPGATPAGVDPTAGWKPPTLTAPTGGLMGG